ncbi:unnamed protein product, partial [Amoebophrya sp. A120]
EILTKEELEQYRREFGSDPAMGLPSWLAAHVHLCHPTTGPRNSEADHERRDIITKMNKEK